LDEIANGKDKDGCWLEPLEEIRSAAARVLGMCPPLPPEPPAKEPEGAETEGAKTEGEESAEDAEGDEAEDAEGEDAEAEEDGAEEKPSEETGGSETVSGRSKAREKSETNNSSRRNVSQSGFSSQKSASSPQHGTTAPQVPAIDPNMIVGRVQHIANGLLYVNFESAYKLPEDVKVIIRHENGFEQEMQILTSIVGQIIVHPTYQTTAPTPWQTGGQVYVGVLVQ